MSGLLSALTSAGSALRDFEKSIGAVQSNVVNASTPGYAKQQIGLSALPFDPSSGLYGGVKSGGIESARDEYAEQAVRREQQQLGFDTEKATSLAAIETVFDITGDGSLSGAINGIFTAFSAWSATPQDGTARQNVITAASELGQSFQQTAADLTKNGNEIIDQARSQVAAINNLTAHIAELNDSATYSTQGNSNDAEMHAALEELSELVNFTTIQGSDGSTTVLMGGQMPLVMGSKSYPLKLETVANGATNGLPEAHIVDASGLDLTVQVTGGKLGGLLETYSQDLGSILGTSSERGTLNDLAYSLATRINEILESGQIDNPDPPATPTPGKALFLVNADSSAAATLRADPAIDTTELAAISPGPPMSANGIPTQLAALANPTKAADKIGGASFSDFYGSIAAEIGTRSASANTAKARQEQLASQAKSMRSDIQGVSLDEEAANLMQFQRSYEATARMVTVVNELMDNLINMIRQ